MRYLHAIAASLSSAFLLAGSPGQATELAAELATEQRAAELTPHVCLDMAAAYQPHSRKADHDIDNTSYQDASLVSQWNNLALEWIRMSERGPTISSRFSAYVNIALYDAWAAYDENAAGIVADTDTLYSSTRGARRIAASRNIAMACAAHTVINAIGETVLRQEHLEIGVGEDAVARLSMLKAQSDQLLLGTFNESGTLVGRDQRSVTRLRKFIEAAHIAKEVSDAVLHHALNDGSNQQNNYADTTGFTVTPWVQPVPEANDGISDYDFLGSGYTFASFDPTLAESGNSGTATVHPLVMSGDLQLTDTWQSLTELGVFPPVDDGGQQYPLTPQWGSVSTFVLDSGDQLRPDTVVGPYDREGNLNPQWLHEAHQLLEFSSVLQDGADGSAIQRARSEYWELGDATEYPPGWWLQRATDIARNQNLSQRDALKLLLAVSIATFESGISAWDTKFHFNTVRPITAINELYYGSMVPDWRGETTANTDDRDHWRPYQLRRNLTPPFPDVPSGHSGFSTSASVVMKQLLGSNNFDYTTDSFVSRFDLTDGFDGNPDTGNEEASLEWDYLSLAAEEAGLSRLYGGIHMMEGNLLGLKTGTQLGHMTVRYVNTLFGDISLDVPTLVFGTGLSDAQLSTPEGVCGSVEIYGFHEDDALHANLSCHGMVDLFGGAGQDTYSVEGNGTVWVRDYEYGEIIHIGHSRLNGSDTTASGGGWIDGHHVSAEVDNSHENAPYTALIVDGNPVVRIEGEWSLSDLSIQIGMPSVNADDDCDYSAADLNNGWGWNETTYQSCEPLQDHPTDASDDCDYSSADVNGGWGWNETTYESCPPLQ